MSDAEEKSCLLKKIPSEVYKMIQTEQAEIKKRKGTGLFSLERTIYTIIKEYNRCKNSSPNFKPEQS